MSAVYDCFRFSVPKLSHFFALSVPLRINSESLAKTNSNDQ